MPAYSIFALGTFETHSNEKNIITQFYAECDGTDKLLLNGPQKLIDPKTVEQNVNTAIQNIFTWLKTRAQSNEKGKYQINLTGFSRGAITAIRIANQLSVLLRKAKTLKNQNNEMISRDDIELNIFAIDPVAGLFEKYKRRSQVLPDIVRNYTAILQMHEYRNDLKPQDIKRIHVIDPRKTCVVMLPMYGHHRSIKKITHPNLSHCTQIVWQHLYRFMQEHNSKFLNFPAIPDAENNLLPAKLLNDFELLQLYTDAKKNKKAYKNADTGGISLSGNGHRSFVKYLVEYVSDPDFFMNEYEKFIFKKNYPAVMSYFFEDGADAPYARMSDFQNAVHQELIRMRKESLVTFLSLAEKNVYQDENGLIHIPMATSGVRPLALAEDVMRKLHRYRHIKPEWKVFSKPDEFDRSVEIEYEIKRIKYSQRNMQSKNQLILDYIEHHYFDLYHRGSSSKLLNYLENILHRHGRQYQDKAQLGCCFLLGKSIEFLGSIIKKTGQAAALIIGLTGIITEFSGNLLNAIGYGLAQVFYYSKIFYPLGWLVEGGMKVVGTPVSLIGQGIKYLTKKCISPLLEFLGKNIRSLGQLLLSKTDVFRLTRNETKKSLPVLSSRVANPILQNMLRKQTPTNEVKPVIINPSESTHESQLPSMVFTPDHKNSSRFLYLR